MDTSTHEVRLANWRSVVEQCAARPEGQTVKQWLEINGIKEKQYYESLRLYQGNLLFVGINYDENAKTHSCKIERFEKN